MTFSTGERIRAFRFTIRMTQLEFAEKFGLSYSRVKSYETNRVKVTEDEFCSICALYPEVAEFLVSSGKISISRLLKSESEHSKELGKFLQVGVRPKEVDINEYIES